MSSQLGHIPRVLGLARSLVKKMNPSLAPCSQAYGTANQLRVSVSRVANDFMGLGLFDICVLYFFLKVMAVPLLSPPGAIARRENHAPVWGAATMAVGCFRCHEPTGCETSV